MTQMDKIVDYIYSIPKFTKKGGMIQTAQIMALFEHPENDFTYVHIAGTNGKGSVSAYMAGMLRACRLKVGLFTSPHLVRINERMKINGEDISDGDFIRIFFTVKEKIDVWMKEGGVHPTFFEFIYLMAMLWFRENHIDIAVVETGLGGRLDATNVVAKPALTVITSIGFDHMQYLGHTIDKIAGEKAGIMKDGCPVIFDGTSQPEAVCVLSERAAALGCACTAVTQQDIGDFVSDKESLRYTIPALFDGRKLSVVLPTPARYQAMNSALALRGMEMLWRAGRFSYQYPASEDSFYAVILKALSKVRWSGRFEMAAPDIYIDGAHNEAGIKAFCESIEYSFSDKPVYLLFAVAEDKDYTEMIRRLCSLQRLAGVMVTAIESERQTSVDLVEQIFKENWHGRIEGTYNIKEALERAAGWIQGGRLFCTGSLYLAGSLMALQKKK